MQYKLENPVHATIGIVKYQCTVEWRNGKFIVDEPVKSGGKDTGPDPYTLLLSSLACCALITMRMYIERKGWNMPEIAVNANLYQETKDGKTTTMIDRDIVFSGEVSEEQKNRLHEIAKHCPISKILEGELKLRTFLFREELTAKKINCSNNEITVVWKPELCQHSTRCFTQLPEVFNPRIKKWINPNGASLEKIIEQVKKCPGGALTILEKSKQTEQQTHKISLP
jgi:putative redox protein